MKRPVSARPGRARRRLGADALGRAVERRARERPVRLPDLRRPGPRRRPSVPRRRVRVPAAGGTGDRAARLAHRRRGLPVGVRPVDAAGAAAVVLLCGALARADRRRSSPGHARRRDHAASLRRRPADAFRPPSGRARAGRAPPARPRPAASRLRRPRARGNDEGVPDRDRARGDRVAVRGDAAATRGRARWSAGR